MNAKQAIAQSRAQDEIVTIDYTESAYETLLAECDDHVETSLGTPDEINEFWANDPESEDKMAWRVHLRTPRA